MAVGGPSNREENPVPDPEAGGGVAESGVLEGVVLGVALGVGVGVGKIVAGSGLGSITSRVGPSSA